MTDNAIDPIKNTETTETTRTTSTQITWQNPKREHFLLRIVLAVLIFGSGLGSGYLLWGRNDLNHTSLDEMTAMVNAVNPKEGFKIQAKYGDIGPKLLAAGAIDLDTFEQLYQQSGQPLSVQEIDILTKGSQDQIVITRENAHFLLNYFGGWD